MAFAADVGLYNSLLDPNSPAAAVNQNPGWPKRGAGAHSLSKAATAHYSNVYGGGKCKQFKVEHFIVPILISNLKIPALFIAISFILSGFIKMKHLFSW